MNTRFPVDICVYIYNYLDFESLCIKLDKLMLTMLETKKREILENKYKTNVYNDAAKTGQFLMIKYLESICVDFYSDGLLFAVSSGNMRMIKYMISKGADDWNLAMELAAKHGNRDLVDYFISKGAYSFDLALGEAAGSGKKEMVDYLISKGIYDWGHSLALAAGNNDKKMFNYLMIKKRQSYLKGIPHGRTCDVLTYAAMNNHKEMIDYLISCKFGPGSYNYGSAMVAAARNNHKDMVDYMMSKGSITPFTVVNIPDTKPTSVFDIALSGAAEDGHRDMVEYMITLGATELNNAMIVAAGHDHIEIVDYLISKGADVYVDSVFNAINGNRLDMIIYLEEYCDLDYDVLMEYTGTCKHIDIMKYMISQGGSNYAGAIEVAKDAGYWVMVKFLKKEDEGD